MSAKQYNLKSRREDYIYDFTFDPETQEFGGPSGEEVEKLVEEVRTETHILMFKGHDLKWKFESPDEITEAELGAILEHHAEIDDKFPPLDWSKVVYDEQPGLLY